MSFSLKNPKRRFWAIAQEPRARFWILAVFLFGVALLGGSSRADSLATLIIRPLSFIVIAYAVLIIGRDQLSSIRIPLALLFGLSGLAALQLLPLPPSIWSELPGRAEILEMYHVAEMTPPWLPLALSPSRATNALMSMSIPLAGLLLFAVQDHESRKRGWSLVWVLVLISVIVGMAQLAGSGGRGLYFHRITNPGLPVGLFANRNHQALFVCIGILLAAAKFATDSRGRRSFAFVATLSLGSLLVFVPFLLTIGSRAGLIIGSTLLLPSFALVYFAVQQRSKSGRKSFSPQMQKIGFGLLVSTAVAIIVAAIAFSRSLSFDRLVEKGGGDAIRSETLPIVAQMTIDSLPFGIGFGAFDLAYRRVEPLELLMPSYLNQAHNDWLQFILEGGALAGVLLSLFIVWAMAASFQVVSSSRKSLRPYGLASAGTLAAFAVASSVDYPLRVPTLSLLFAFACVQLAFDSRSNAIAVRDGEG
ncbi:O-antigen ligase family protein [Altererythrobacter sp. MF3-039]|uniref:O-antigen ligase family protein n=1 Tax=Altererythrobacter sp. MF3-039 TaxID=3252901 RepID=UPI00390CD801